MFKRRRIGCASRDERSIESDDIYFRCDTAADDLSERNDSHPNDGTIAAASRWIKLSYRLAWLRLHPAELARLISGRDVLLCASDDDHSTSNAIAVANREQ